MYASSLSDLEGVDAVATISGWNAPTYANTWNDAVQVVYARDNYTRNQNAGNTVQREYVTKDAVGKVMNAYQRLRIAGKVGHYNPANKQTVDSIVAAIQSLLGSEAPQRDIVASVMRQFVYGVEGTPQQINPNILYTVNTAGQLTPAEQKIIADYNARAAANGGAAAMSQEDCGIWCSAKNSIKSILGLPGAIVDASSTTAKFMSVAMPVVLIGAVTYALWVVGRKVLELDSTKAATDIGKAYIGRK